MERLTQYDTYSVRASQVFYDSEFNCRGSFTMESIQELANSIKQYGLQFPVVIQPWDRQPGYRFRIVAGHRRFVAMTKFLKQTEVPAQVRADLDERQARILNFTENLERKDLNMLEEAKAVGRAFADLPLKKVAEAIHRPERWVMVRRQLMSLPDEIQLMAASGSLKATHIQVIWSAPAAKRIDLARRIVEMKVGGNHQFKQRDEDLIGNNHRRTKPMIRQMIGQLLDVAGMEGCEDAGIAPRALAWCLGCINDDRFVADFREYLCIQKQLRDVIDNGK